MVKLRDIRRSVPYDDLTDMLPTQAYNKGMTLTWWQPEALQIATDPVILELKGRELHRWDYTPSLAEVFEICRQLEASHGD